MVQSLVTFTEEDSNFIDEYKKEKDISSKQDAIIDMVKRIKKIEEENKQ